MFTGIVQGCGEVLDFSNGKMQIKTSLDLNDCKIGSSISCNGACLTVTEINKIDEKFIFSVNLSEETILRTNFKLINKDNSIINLEKSLKFGDEIAGHFVYGHVDCISKILKIEKLLNSWEYTFDKNLITKSIFLVEKTSIAINGISLTVAKVNTNNFTISIIPYTYDNTNLKFNKLNDLVNDYI